MVQSPIYPLHLMQASVGSASIHVLLRTACLGLGLRLMAERLSPQILTLLPLLQGQRYCQSRVVSHWAEF